MMGAARRLLGHALLVLALTPISVSGQDIPEPEEYRTNDYRAPTPATLKGARVIATAEAEKIWRAGGAIFLDVLPHVPRPPDLPAGTIWREKLRRNIPGSIWLPDTGYGAIAPVIQAYLQDNLIRVTGGDRNKAIVVYCLRDCWMSWNAAKRILGIGYANVMWYPEGSDGWAEADLPLQASTPEPMSRNKHAD